MASRAYKPGEYFLPSVPAKSFEHSWEPSEDNSVDISRKDLDYDEPVVDESTRESRSTRKDVEEELPREKSKKSQGKRKASFASESATKKPKKWSWTSEAVEILLKYIKEFQTKCEFNGVNFEADLSTMCAEIRRCMAADFPEDFGHDIVQEPGKELRDMNSEEYEFYRKELEEQKRQIRNGYQRIILVVLYLATVQLSPSALNSIIAIALGTRLCM